MAKLPLEGIRVVDSTYIVALPYAASLLADMGAEVIKLEGPSHPDGTRGGGGGASTFADNDPGEKPWNRATLYHSVNRGKKSLTLDLNTPEGLEALKDLLKVSDIFMENFTPRVTRRWGLDYPNLKKLKPDIIMVSNTGFGHGNGPYSEYPAQANSLEATHGLTHITSYIGSPPMKAASSYYADFLACWAALLGVALALRYRNRTGKGQWIDVGMYQLGCFCTSEFIMDWIANSRLPERIGNRHPWRAPQGCYPCAGQDQWCVVSCGDDEEWAALCQAMGQPALAQDPRFSNVLGRQQHHDELDGIIAEWTRGLDKFEITERLQGAGVPSGPVMDGRDLSLNKHLWAHGFFEPVRFPPESGMGERVYIGRPWHLSKTPVSIQRPSANLGAHNREVLADILGYTEEQLRTLEEKSIIGEKPLVERAGSTLSPQELVRLGRLAYYDPDYQEKMQSMLSQHEGSLDEKKGIP